MTALAKPLADWVEAAVGAPVSSAHVLTGGCSSRMLGLRHRDGSETVLRQMVFDPWRKHAVGLLNREAEVQALLAGVVVAPTPLAVDPDGTATGEPSLLMSRLPGAIDLVRCDDEFLSALAASLLQVHRFRPRDGAWPREYQSWAFESKRVVPPWSSDDGLYAEAFERLAAPAPSYERTFLHRDFQPGNVLWRDGAVSGIVDWVETSTGPADLDVAHSASNLATLHGPEVAMAFRKSYVEAGGVLASDRDAAVYWQLLDLVAFLPAGGRESGASEDVMTATWRANGRPDLTPALARQNREGLLRLILAG
jgi:aminoglycoside phosphotransferase (APT) family kinase protein